LVNKQVEAILGKAIYLLRNKKYEEALTLLMEADKYGDARASFLIGLSYDYGHGVEQDYKEAVKWYHKAADAKIEDACLNLGTLYEKGCGVEQDYKEAAKLYRKAAELGNDLAMFKLGYFYDNGYGVSPDGNESISWYQKAACKGDCTSMFNLALIYQFGRNGIKQNYLKAAEWYRKAADLGDVASMINLGQFYDNGSGVAQNYLEAAKWYRKAADLGNADAMNNLGVLYDNGDGVEQNYLEAFKYFNRAAGLGNTDAMCNLGLAYAQGNGVGQDYEEAVKWYRKAASIGNPVAMCRLGNHLEYGEGVEQDLQEALKWYKQSFNNGYSEAKNKISKLSSRLENIAATQKESPIMTNTNEYNDYISELNSLIGLKSVKSQINDLVTFVVAEKKRNGGNLNVAHIGLNYVFTGNPGTGKTTVARILGKIFNGLGLLKTDHVVEVSRGDLCGEYVGHTAVKTQERLTQALDGIMFIDEAYSLYSPSPIDFGHEAVEAILKYMEDNKGRISIIAAGYKGQMDDFINSNPGLRSRFTRKIEFEDFSSDEMLQIFIKMAKDNGFAVDADAIKKIKQYFEVICTNKDVNFANARTVRNLFEDEIWGKRFSKRYLQINNPTNEQGHTIIGDDIPEPPEFKTKPTLGF